MVILQIGIISGVMIVWMFGVLGEYIYIFLEKCVMCPAEIIL